MYIDIVVTFANDEKIKYFAYFDLTLYKFTQQWRHTRFMLWTVHENQYLQRMFTNNCSYLMKIGRVKEKEKEKKTTIC